LAEERDFELLRAFDPPPLLRAPPAPELLLPLELLLPPLLFLEEPPPLLFFALDEPLLLPAFLELAEGRFEEAEDLEPPDDERPLLLPPLLPPPLLPPAFLELTGGRFADFDGDDLLDLEDLLPPPFFEEPPAFLALTGGRFADFEPFDEAGFDDDFDDLLDLADFELTDAFAPPLLEPPLFFAPFDALFFAAMLILLFQKVFGGEPYF